MPRKGAEPGPLVILNNALAGRSLLVTDCCADGRIRNGRPLTSNLTSDLTKNNLNPQNHLQVPKSVLWSLELSRGPGSKGYFPPSDSHHIKASVCNQNQCQGLTIDLFDVSH